MVTMECVEKVIRRNGMVCTISGQKLKDDDIITIVGIIMDLAIAIMDSLLISKLIFSETSEDGTILC